MNNLRKLIRVIAVFENWGTFLFEYLFRRQIKRICVYRTTDEVIHNVRGKTDDRFVLGEIYIHDAYSPDGFEPEEGQIIVDIGAHIGVYTNYSARRGAKVFSYEPIKENFMMLRKNIKDNNFRNVKPNMEAVASEPGTANIYVSDNPAFTARHSLLPFEKDGQIRLTKITSLDKIMKKYKLKKIDILKMDCEGTEYEILLHLSDIMFSRINKIALEYHADAKTLRELLIRKGYNVKRHPTLPILYADRRLNK